MKNKLFVAAISLFFYTLVVIGLDVADANQQIPQVLSVVGLTSNSSDFESVHGNLIDPMPRPPKVSLIDPMPRPPKVSLIDPMPRPPKTSLIDPMPRPPKSYESRIDPMPRPPKTR